MKGIVPRFPETVKQTRDLQRFCDERTRFFNEKAIFTKNQGEIVNNFDRKMQKSMVPLPDPVLARNTEPFRETKELYDIQKYKDQVKNEEGTGLFNIDKLF